MSKKTFKFDKFMDKFIKQDEDKRNKAVDYGRGTDQNPARQLNKLYKELWQNRIRWRR